MHTALRAAACDIMGISVEHHASSMCRSMKLPGDGAVFEMTGKTGSYFYMAPEVANEQPYNEKASMGSAAT